MKKILGWAILLICLGVLVFVVINIRSNNENDSGFELSVNKTFTCDNYCIGSEEAIYAYFNVSENKCYCYDFSDETGLLNVTMSFLILTQAELDELESQAQNSSNISRALS